MREELPVSQQSLPGPMDLPVVPSSRMRIRNVRQALSLKRSIRLGVVAFFFAQGLCFSSWASRIPDIKNMLGLSDAGLGSILFALPLGSMSSLPLSGWMVTRFGSKKMVITGALLYALTLLMIGLTNTIWQLTVTLFLFGLVGNLVNIAVNTQAIGVENMYKKSIMASFHGAWSLAGFTGAAIGALMVLMNIGPSLHFMSIALITLFLILGAQRFTLRGKLSSAAQPFFAMPDNPLLRLGLIGFCGMACEGTMFDWSGVYFQKVVHAPAALTTLGYVVFMTTMAGGRFGGDWLANRIGRKKMIELSGILIASGLLISVIFPYIPSVTIGFLLVGFGVSSVVPLVYSAAGKSRTLSPGMALAAVSTISFFWFSYWPSVDWLHRRSSQPPLFLCSDRRVRIVHYNSGF